MIIISTIFFGMGGGVENIYPYHNVKLNCVQGKGYHIKDCVMTSWWNSGFDGGENVLIGQSNINFAVKT